MSLREKKKEFGQTSVETGNFSKKEAAQRIFEGARHLYSSKGVLGLQLLQLTEKALGRGKIPRFPWERLFFCHRTYVQSSRSRSELIQKAIADLKLEKKRGMRERVEGVLEELLTNAIYHSQTLPDGQDKYNRQHAVVLEESERVVVAYGQKNGGIFISVTDHGGTLNLPEIGRAFSRCYGVESLAQIESKKGGAGLGLYLIFEEVTHLKVVTKKNQWTTISCWISSQNEMDANEFSFNFFEED